MICVRAASAECLIRLREYLVLYPTLALSLPSLCHMHDGVQISLNAATIKTTPIERYCFHGVIGSLSINRIRELYFSPSTRRLIA